MELLFCILRPSRLIRHFFLILGDTIAQRSIENYNRFSLGNVVRPGGLLN
jgi:hypothetical protein